MKKRTILVSVLACILCSLFIADSALAHKVNVFAYVEDGQVYCESYFPDGRAVESGDIEVKDLNGKVLLTGKTNKEGMFDFPLPGVQDLTIVIKASMGHKNSYLLKKTEME